MVLSDSSQRPFSDSHLHKRGQKLSAAKPLGFAKN
jgi:hypothetical protein